MDEPAPDGAKALVKSLLEAMLRPSAPVFIVGGLIVLFLPVLLHYILHRATPYTTLPSILLVGPSGAGKTSFLTLLERGPLSKASNPSPSTSSTTTASEPTPAKTHTSQTAAAIELFVSEDSKSSYTDDLDAAGATAKKFLLIDTPGHGKLRGAALSRLVPAKATAKGSKVAAAIVPGSSLGTQTTAMVGAAGMHSAADTARLKGVVFMLDAAALGSDTDDGVALRDAANYLHDVLLALQQRAASGRSSRHPSAIPVLVAANKSDLFTALPAALVKSQLEAELGRIRKSRSKGLLNSGVGGDEDGVEGSEEEEAWLGEYGSEKFGFGQMREFEIEVEVLGGNTVGEQGGVDKWWAWMARQI
jgi:signal recognition particle receptor subunit beta